MNKSTIKPPRLFLKFFRWFCHPKIRAYIEGDLRELYHRRRQAVGKSRANIRFALDVMLLFRPGIIRPFNQSLNMHEVHKIGNYVKIAWRMLRVQWQHALVSVAGLAVGIACFILIWLYVRHERSYDRYHEFAERIYRVVRDEKNNSDQFETWATTPKAVSVTTVQDMPEVESATTLFQSRPMVMRYGTKQFYEDRVYGTDTSFFNVFTYPLTRGSASNIFATPQSAIITESTARKYFGDEDPLGKPMTSEDMEYFVAGVVDDVPTNSHFKFDILVPLRTSEEIFNTVWGPARYHTYLKIKESVNIDDFAGKFAIYAQSKYERRPFDRFHLQPLTSIHLYSSVKGELEINGNASSIKILITVAVFVIFMAGVNYINLATARSTKRAKEVGIRKVSGALRRGLLIQFLTESVLVALIAFFFALVLIAVSINSFNYYAGVQLTLFDPALWSTWLSFAGIVIAIGLVAGIYPAVYLASFSPSSVLKGGLVSMPGSVGWLRRALVGLQFTVSIVLIIGTTVVISQMDYIGDKHPGFEKDHVIVVPNARMLSNREAMEERISQLAGVVSVGASSGTDVGAPNWTGDIRTAGAETDRMINFCQINYDYLDALGIRLLEGRNFSKEFPADTINTLILNEAAVRDLNLADPIGQRLIWDASSLDTALYAQVVGVVNDFHFTSFHEEIKPFAFLIRNNFFVQKDFTSRLFVKVTGDPRELTRQIERIWKEFAPDRPFSYSYLDDNFERLHADEERFKVLFSCLTVLGIFIVSIGLFAMVSFVSQQRTKEIGIRKVLGASAASIMVTLNRDFALLVVLSFGFAAPVGLYFMGLWLESFVYRISLEWWMFALAGVVACAIVVLTTTFQSVKASLENPIKSLRMD